MRTPTPVKPKTPKKINASIKTLISKLGLKPKDAKFLQYTHTSDEYRATYCFNNCEIEAKKSNCEVIYGWQIWEDKRNSFVEAEFHSVIRDEKGRLIDISPRQTGDKKILFIPDKTRNSGRKCEDTWASWTNIRMQNGILFDEPQEIEVKEIDDILSEVRHVDT